MEKKMEYTHRVAVVQTYVHILEHGQVTRVWCLNQHSPHNRLKVRCYLPCRVTSPGKYIWHRKPKKGEGMRKSYSSATEAEGTAQWYQSKKRVRAGRRDFGWRLEFPENQITKNLKTPPGIPIKGMLGSLHFFKTLMHFGRNLSFSKFQIFIKRPEEKQIKQIMKR